MEDIEARQAVSLYDLICDLGMDVDPSLVQFSLGDFDSQLLAKILNWLGQTEAINQEWTSLLASLQEEAGTLLDAVQTYLASDSYDSALWNRLYQYLFYRQLDALEEGYSLGDLATYASRNVFFILVQVANGADFIRSVVDWSEQIEYDTDNVGLLLSTL